MNIFSIEQISRTRNLDADFILGQSKLDLMARFMEVKSVNPKLNQIEIAKELGYSSSTLERYRQDIKLQSPHKSINPKKRQMTSNDLKTPQITAKESVIDSVESSLKNQLKCCNPNDPNLSNGRDLI